MRLLALPAELYPRIFASPKGRVPVAGLSLQFLDAYSV